MYFKKYSKPWFSILKAFCSTFISRIGELENSIFDVTNRAHFIVSKIGFSFLKKENCFDKFLIKFRSCATTGCLTLKCFFKLSLMDRNMQVSLFECCFGILRLDIFRNYNQFLWNAYSLCAHYWTWCKSSSVPFGVCSIFVWFLLKSFFFEF